VADATRRVLRWVLGLSLARIVLTPVVMALLLLGLDRRGVASVAAALFLVAAITDFLDGRLARRWGVATTLGAFLDTTADKLLVSGVLIALVAVGRASAWVAAIIIGRELVILGLRGVVATGGAVMAPSIWGKLKTNVQVVAIVLAILRPPLLVGPLYVDEWVMIAAAFVTVMSAIEYLSRFSSQLSLDAARERPQ
jgi:CDP-diacylglycerol---glycerol-3-phosphate 3-phosphatidyltransferase